MKFDFAIGNPPYQETQEGTSDNPIYNCFMDVAYEIAEKALWKHFIKYYYEAYDVALHNAQKRLIMNS